MEVVRSDWGGSDGLVCSGEHLEDMGDHHVIGLWGIHICLRMAWGTLSSRAKAQP